jgi:hypothetical protein
LFGLALESGSVVEPSGACLVALSPYCPVQVVIEGLEPVGEEI